MRRGGLILPSESFGEEFVCWPVQLTVCPGAFLILASTINTGVMSLVATWLLRRAIWLRKAIPYAPVVGIRQ